VAQTDTKPVPCAQTQPGSALELALAKRKKKESPACRLVKFSKAIKVKFLVLCSLRAQTIICATIVNSSAPLAPASRSLALGLPDFSLSLTLTGSTKQRAPDRDMPKPER